MKRILITGATGFIGRHCLRQLVDKGYGVHAVAHRRPSFDLTGVQWHLADLLDSGNTSDLICEVKPTHLIHFAWYAMPVDYRSSPENLRWCQASLELLRAFAANGGEHAVFAGTCFEYDDRYGYCSERLTPSVSSTLYGTCKSSFSNIALHYANQFGIRAASGRIFFVYGPHEAPVRLVPNVIRKLLFGRPAECSHGEQVRDYMHVQDVADAFVAVLESQVSGAINIASGTPVKLKDIIYSLADMLDGRHLVRLGALAPSTNEPSVLLADIGRLRDEVGWRPRIDLRTGLADTVSWWRNFNLEPSHLC
ncbi:MAG: NAD-dependent epimerase/dehydratase family protein [Candidatus Binataceae bacterium]